jgi:hypothetical protein
MRRGTVLACWSRHYPILRPSEELLRAVWELGPELDREDPPRVPGKEPADDSARDEDRDAGHLSWVAEFRERVTASFTAAWAPMRQPSARSASARYQPSPRSLSSEAL